MPSTRITVLITTEQEDSIKSSILSGAHDSASSLIRAALSAYFKRRTSSQKPPLVQEKAHVCPPGSQT